MNIASLMISACFLVWCLGQGIGGADRFTATYDMPRHGRTEQIFAYEGRWAAVGFVQQRTVRNAVFLGALPLKIDVFAHFLSLEGGAILATAAVPRHGTHANFMATARLHLTRRIDLAYWHWSNAHLGRSNPSVNAVGLSVRLRTSHQG